jgi:hypothetical protein
MKLIYLTFIHCTCKFEKHKQYFLTENCEQTSLIRSINNVTHMKSINSLSLVKNIVEFSITKTLKKVVRCSICVLRSTLILLLKTVRCSIHSL